MKAFMTSTEGLVRLGFLIGIGLVMLSELAANDTVAANTTANSTINEIITGIGEYGGWVGLIVLIVVGAYFFKNMNFGQK